MRIIILRTTFLILLALLTANLFVCQIINGQYFLTLSEQNRIRALPIPALRGRILDIAGTPIADNRPSYEVSLVPEDFDRNDLKMVAEVLSMKEKEIKKVLDAGKKVPFVPVLVRSDAGMEEVFKLEELQPEIEGMHIEIRGRRFYPLGAATSHVTGYIGMVSQDEYERSDRSRFLFSDYIGRAGIEYSFDDQLRGFHGGKQIEVNARGRILRTLSERPPSRGQDIRLTIDGRLQSALYELIKDKRAVIGLMDLSTDGVLALVSTPGYDPNAFVTSSRGKERMEYLTSPEKPMLNQAVQAGFPLGSVFKLVVALGALQEGLITPNTMFHCDGSFSLKSGQRPFKCWRESGHGAMNLMSAIEQSCNVYFYEVGRKLGAERIARYARELGLGSTWDTELGKMFPGVVPDPKWKLERIGEKWYQGETISFAIGQSYLLVSPLQVLRLVSTIAKDGVVTEPHIVMTEEGGEHHDSSKLKRAKIDMAHFKSVKNAMREVIDSPAGTGQLARMDSLDLAGKTGTAQTPVGEAHSWFTGFGPFDDPKFAIVVFIEHGGSGGQAAAPLARSALEIWQNLENPINETKPETE